MVTDTAFVKSALPVIPAAAHKYMRGHLVVLAGSEGMAGALILSLSAALRAGAGFITALVPESIYGIAAPVLPEVVFRIYRDHDSESLRKIAAPVMEVADAMVTGPGLGEMKEAALTLSSAFKGKLLLDADALTALSEKEDMTFCSSDVVLTPHEGEMARLLHTDTAAVREDREKSAALCAAKYHAAVLLKGKNTLIAKEGKDFFMNETGNPGLARAGSGDALSGIIGALMAEGESAFDAAVSGAFIHGKAAEKAAVRMSLRSMRVTDVIDDIPAVFREIEGF